MKRLVSGILILSAGCADVLHSVTQQAARDAADATHRILTGMTAPQQPAPQPQQQVAQQQPQAIPASAQQPAQPQALKLTGKLAVLELRNFTKDLTRENAQYFTDVIRQASLRMEPGLDVMTRENLVVLLEASGKKLDECEGECEVDTGRRIGADNIVSGDLQKVGSKYKLSLKLHDTHAGKLLGTSIASGSSVDELDTNIQKAAEELYVVK